MRILLFSFCLLLLRPLWGQVAQVAPAALVGHISPEMRAAFPVIDGLFKDYAARNHYPGFVYGLVADGKLVFMGGVGYSNVEKKIPATPASD